MTPFFRCFGRLTYKAPLHTVNLAQESWENGEQTWQVHCSIFDAEAPLIWYNDYSRENICKYNLSSDKFPHIVIPRRTAARRFPK